jgi:holo-[acyl-carrier protein] synthase
LYSRKPLLLRSVAGIPSSSEGRRVMEIVGIGTDIVECVRIARMIEQHGELFLTRVYTDREIRYCQARRKTTEHFAERWAAKEAILRSLGTGWRRGLCWTDMEVRNDLQGLPRVSLRGAVRELADKLSVGTVLLSVSHCRAYAVAYATAVRAVHPPPL